jgi:hypothetical protein
LRIHGVEGRRGVYFRPLFSKQSSRALWRTRWRMKIPGLYRRTGAAIRWLLETRPHRFPFFILAPGYYFRNRDCEMKIAIDSRVIFIQRRFACSPCADRAHLRQGQGLPPRLFPLSGLLHSESGSIQLISKAGWRRSDVGIGSLAGIGMKRIPCTERQRHDCSAWLLL